LLSGGVLISIFCISLLYSQNIKAQISIHAHNDYLNKRPLWNALAARALGIEIDLYVYKQQLCISHLPTGVFKKRSIEHEYLIPLVQRIHQNHGSVYGDGKTVTLLLDIKSKPDKIMPHLARLLDRYAAHLTVFSQETTIYKPITILLCNMPAEMVPATALFALDTKDTLLQIPKNQVWKYRMFSQSWQKWFQSKQFEQLSISQQLLLQNWILKAKALKLPIRFYANPDNQNFWQFCQKHQIDWLHTDKPREVRKFLQAQASSP